MTAVWIVAGLLCAWTLAEIAWRRHNEHQLMIFLFTRPPIANLAPPANLRIPDGLDDAY